MDRFLKKFLLPSVLVLLFFMLPSSLVAKDYDFSTMNEPTKQTNTEKRNLTDQVQLLREGSIPGFKRFEVQILKGTPVWIIAKKRTVHFSIGQNPEFVPGSIQKSVPGQILSLDFYPFPDDRKGLISVVAHVQNRIKSIIFSFQRTNQRLTVRKVEQRDGIAFRPLSQFVYGQAFRSSSMWNSSINQYRTGKSGYREAQSLQLPVSNPRLLSLTSMGKNRWIHVSPDGRLELLSRKRILSSIKGNFGLTKKKFASDRSLQKRPETGEILRLPAAFLPSQNLVAAVQNPAPEQGFFDSVLGQSSGQERSMMHLFKLQRNQFKQYATVGPLSGRITDLHVSEANGNQLLWLRKTKSNSYKLEMIDFSNL